jgi:hypothetical protein
VMDAEILSAVRPLHQANADWLMAVTDAGIVISVRA